MNITINGQLRSLGSQLNLDQLIELLELQGKKLAIEVNRKIVPRSLYAGHTLKEEDVIEIVQAIGGG